jgi:thioredoxin-dependent peroxiredoxin
MKLQANQQAPTFTTKDVNGKSIDLKDFQQKKVLMIFFRNVGCPVCNLQFHQLESNAEFFASKNTIVMAIYESTQERMKEFVGNQTFKTILVPDSGLALYNQFGLELSTLKLLKGLFNGAIGKANAGKKLFKKSIKQDGNTNRMGGEFLINEKGKVMMAHYADYLGEDLPMDKLKSLL